MVDFRPGFSNYRGTRPGFALENNAYHLTFGYALINGKRPRRPGLFEDCYDWTKVMNILIDSLKNFKDVETSEELAMEDLKSWFLTYDGFGLLISFLPFKQQLEFKQTLRDLKQNWPLPQEHTEVDYACWELFSKDIDIEAIVPDFEVAIKEVDCGCEAGRKKCINLKFNKVDFVVKFLAEKKKIEGGNLVAISARAVAAQLEDFDDMDNLEIPRTLMKPVAQMMEDLRWISTFAIYGTTVKKIRKIQDY